MAKVAAYHTSSTEYPPTRREGLPRMTDPRRGYFGAIGSTSWNFS